MLKGLIDRIRTGLKDETGLATVEWIGLGIVILAVMVVVAKAMEGADGSGLATKILEAIGRMLDGIQ